MLEADKQRRWGLYLLLASAIIGVLSILWIPVFRDIWPKYREEPYFMVIFFGGLSVIAAPFITLTFAWVNLQRSLFEPRTKATPVTDLLIYFSRVAFLLTLLWFGADNAVAGLVTGTVQMKYANPNIIANPIDFWFAEIFWIAMTGALAYGAAKQIPKQLACLVDALSHH